MSESTVNKTKNASRKRPTTGVALPPELHERIRRYAQEDRRTQSDVMRMAIDDWLRQRGF